jgi:hypothetical protein
MNIAHALCIAGILLVAPVDAAEDAVNATQAAERVIIPKVQFANTPASEAIDALQTLSRRAGKSAPRLNVIVAAPGAQPKMGPPNSSEPGLRVTLQREGASLLELLKELAQQIGCEVQGEAHALVIRPKGAPPIAPIRQGAGVNLQAMREKLDAIVFPRVSLRQATVRDSMEFIVQKMKQLDPGGAGVSVSFKAGEAAPDPAPAQNVRGIPGLPANGARPNPVAIPPPSAPIPPDPEGIPGLPGGVDQAAAPAQGPGEKRISLEASHIPVLELLRYVAGLSDVEVTVEKFAVVIAPPGKK